MRPNEPERKALDAARRHVEGRVRDAEGRGPSHFIFLGKLDAELVESGTALCSIYFYSPINSAWEDSGKKVTVRDFFLGPGETWPASTRVKVEWYETTWVVTQASCSPDSGGGGGGGGSPAAQSGLRVGTEFEDDFYPGGTDYGDTFDPFIQDDFDSLIGA